MRFYGNLTKVDEEQRMVWGYASTEATDAHGESILKSAIEAALDDYMDFANIREMHQLSPSAPPKRRASTTRAYIWALTSSTIPRGEKSPRVFIEGFRSAARCWRATRTTRRSSPNAVDRDFSGRQALQPRSAV